MPFCVLPAITVMPVIRVSPIISAEAVVAVRRGLRSAFCRARRPEMPKARRTGVASAISGRDSSGVRMNTPTSSSIPPPPSMILLVSSPSYTEVATTTEAVPMPATSAPRVLRTSSDLVVATACTLFIAATGGTFAPRRAGSQAASTVMRVPMPRAATAVEGETTSGPSGNVATKPFSTSRSSAAMPIPATRPETPAIAPTKNASIRTERVT